MRVVVLVVVSALASTAEKQSSRRESSKQTTMSGSNPKSILAPSRLSFTDSSKKIDQSSSNSTNRPPTFFKLQPSKLQSLVKSEEAVKPVVKKVNEGFVPLAQATKKETTPPPSAIASRKVEEEKPSFVFGQNLKDRCEFSNVDEADKKATSTEETTKKPAAETPAEDKKTLQESAEDYCNLHAKVVSVPEVEITTGEENETNVFHMSAKLYIFDKDKSSWQERGRGQLRLNDLRVKSDLSEEGSSSRVIMRTAGVLRVILNSKIFPEMTLEKPTERNIRLTAMDGIDQGIKIFLISGSVKDISTLFVALTHRLEAVRKLTPPSNKSPAVKRKLPDTSQEEPPEKKDAKSEDKTDPVPSDE